MKHLKLFELFSKEITPIEDDIFNTINDILYDIKDNGFDVVSEKGQYSQDNGHGNYKMKDSINIDIDKNGDPFYVEEILECIKRLKKYTKIVNLKITIEYDGNGTEDYLSISDFIEEFSGEEMSRICIIIHK